MENYELRYARTECFYFPLEQPDDISLAQILMWFMQHAKQSVFHSIVGQGDDGEFKTFLLTYETF